jgi:hypothetical protein
MQARAQNEAQAATYRQTVLAAFQSVEDQLYSLRILSEELAQQQRATLAAKHTVELSMGRYRNGVDSYVNVITAENAFLSARETELQVRLRQLTATAVAASKGIPTELRRRAHESLRRVPASSRPVSSCACAHDIGVLLVATRDAVELRPGASVLGRDVPTGRAGLAGMMRRHRDELSPVPRQLVLQLSPELVPPLIEDGFVQSRLGGEVACPVA